jgi:DNA-binding NarL/FixJ family response regulator
LAAADEADIWLAELASRADAIKGLDSAALAGLTRRELEVPNLVADGRTNREIAEVLFISIHTVKRHISTILRKLDLPSRLAAAAYLRDNRLS